MSPSPDPAEAVVGSWVDSWEIPGQIPGWIPGEVCPGMYGEPSGPILMKVCRIFTGMVQLCRPQYEKN